MRLAALEEPGLRRPVREGKKEEKGRKKIGKIKEKEKKKKKKNWRFITYFQLQCAKKKGIIDKAEDRQKQNT